MQKLLIVILSLATFLAGCSPNQNPVDTQAQVNTAVAQTMEAQRQVEEKVAQTVAAQIPASTSTVEFTLINTPLLIPTFVVVIPTDTLIIANTPSANGGSTNSSGSVASTQAKYSCGVINRRPFDLTNIHHGNKFDIKWTIVNTGTKTWDAGMDVKYFSGPKMTTVKVVEIPVKMKPNDTYKIVLEAVAPTKKGRQVMTWTVQGQLCYPYVAIIVK